jgi:hypothetical protein
MDTKQTHRWFTGHTGHVSISWHICNNVDEWYDSSKHDGKWGEMSALDGSLLYVWCDVHLTDSDMVRRIGADYDLNAQLCDDMQIVTL